VTAERYPLRALFDLREAARAAARETLAAASQETKRARARLDRLQARRNAAAAELTREEGQRGDRLARSPTAGQASSAEAYRQRLRDDLDRATTALAAPRDALAASERTLRQARDALASAEAELVAIERHRDRWLAEQRRGLARRQEREVEELASARRDRDAG